MGLASLQLKSFRLPQHDFFLSIQNNIINKLYLFAEPPAFQILPSLKRLKQRVLAASRGQYDAVFMSGRYIHRSAY